MLGPIDRAWLEMDDPRNPMVVSSILELDGPAPVTALGRILAERLLRYHRFRQCADTRSDPPRWVPHEAFNLDYHVRISPLPAHASDEELRRAIARELGTGLDRAQPLWRLTLFRRPGGRATVLFRGHHAMADGLAFLSVLVNCADGAPRARAAPAETPAPHHGPLGGVLDRMETVNTVLEHLIELAADDLRHPSHALAQLRESRRALTAVGRVLALPDDNPPALHAALAGRRAVGWTSGLPLARIRRLARNRGAKVNDVFLAALAGAFGRYLRETGSFFRDDQNLRVSVPVNLRSDAGEHMGNYFGLVQVDLPIGIADGRERLRLVAARMDALKRSPEARAVLFALAAAGHLPAPLEKGLVNIVGGKAVAVVSNLAGPPRRLRIGGARLANMVFWPPQAGGIGIGVSLFSYAGGVTVGVSADTARIADPQRVVALFEAELRGMMRGAAPRRLKLRPVDLRQRPARAAGIA